MLPPPRQRRVPQKWLAALGRRSLQNSAAGPFFQRTFYPCNSGRFFFCFQFLPFSHSRFPIKNAFLLFLLSFSSSPGVATAGWRRGFKKRGGGEGDNFKLFVDISYTLPLLLPYSERGIRPQHTSYSYAYGVHNPKHSHFQMCILAYFLLCACSFLNKKNSPIERESPFSSFLLCLGERRRPTNDAGRRREATVVSLSALRKAELRRHTATDADAAFTNPTNSSPLSQ